MKTPSNLNRFFDHTILKADAVWGDVEKICREAAQYHFFSVCVNPVWVSDCKNYFKHNQVDDVSVCTVIGFPLGANASKTKFFEIEQALSDGADECDVVINIGKLKMGETNFVFDELKRCKQLMGDKIFKVIIETCLLTDEEKKLATKLVVDSGCDFVKTSTGFSTGGATAEDVALMKSITEDQIAIKASGGIRNLQTALSMIEAGASRIGASAGVSIMKELSGGKALGGSGY